MTLSVPAFAVLMTSEMSWGPEDFVAFGLMLTGFSLSIEAAWYWLDTPLKRLCAVIFAVLAFLIVWAELAVGLFD